MIEIEDQNTGTIYRGLIIGTAHKPSREALRRWCRKHDIEPTKERVDTLIKQITTGTHE